MGSWWVPCVFPSKMVGSWWAPCVFPSKMGSARMKFKWFFCRDIWVSHCYILGQPGRSQIQCHLPCTKILTQSGTSTVRLMPEQDQQEGAEPAVASSGEDPAEDHSPFLPLPIPEPELPPVPDHGTPMTYSPSIAPTSPAARSLPEPAAEPMREIALEEPARSPTRSPKPELDPLTVSLYQPATEEDFRGHRRRFELQETLSLFGPNRRLHHQAAQQVSRVRNLRSRRRRRRKMMHYSRKLSR